MEVQEQSPVKNDHTLILQQFGRSHQHKSEKSATIAPTTMKFDCVWEIDHYLSNYHSSFW